MARIQFAIAICLATLSACAAVGYGPIENGRPYGYSETKKVDGSYVLRIVHPNPELAFKFWDQRAKELCGSDGYAKNIYRADHLTVVDPKIGGLPAVALLEGYLTCGSATPSTVAAPADPAS